MYRPIDTLDCMKNLLLKQVVFTIGEKSVRKGKLLLFTSDNYYVKFVLQTNKNINKNYEIPYPYKVTHTDMFVRFSYKLLDLCRDNTKKLQMIEEYIDPAGANKLHDKRLTISIIEQV